MNNNRPTKCGYTLKACLCCNAYLLVCALTAIDHVLRRSIKNGNAVFKISYFQFCSNYAVFLGLALNMK